MRATARVARARSVWSVEVRLGPRACRTALSFVPRSLFEQFGYAGTDLWDNLCAWLLGEPTNWSNLHIFYDKVFYPYMIGGILPGIVTGLVAYYLTVPLIRAYQNRRKGALNGGACSLHQFTVPLVVSS